MDTRALHLLTLKRIDDVCTTLTQHDLALFGDEDLVLEGTVQETHINTKWRTETQIFLKVVRMLLPTTALAAGVALIWDIWFKVIGN